MHRRFLGLLVAVTIGGAGHAAPSEVAVAQPQTQPLDAGTGFHLEGKPEVDDVFGDASDYRRTIDRFIELAGQMQSMRDEFARSVQTALNELGARTPDKKGGSPRKPGHCPSDSVAAPYAKAHRLGVDYLRIGRELTRHYDQVKEFDHLGESIGLTPDYRWKVKRVLQQYATLLTDYREMKVAFHDQLVDELKYSGCDLQALLIKGDPQAVKVGIDETWPQPGQPGAPGVQVAKNDPVPHETVPPNLPAERVPPPQPIPLPKHPAPADPTGTETRSGVLFYVDNTKCQRSATLYVDGKRIGDVPAATRVGFQAVPGPHDLCLIDATKKDCGAPGTVRRSYLHEGWTISLRCE
ncbi:MAG TPA: hypothetical protein VHB97_10220 [Polyangia bacterium]|jgi:hypothetical protein|nr:hypothetical protein [Polyangia bacterium]